MHELQGGNFLNTKKLSTLKIHKLSKTQYDRELASGKIDPDALYFTPSEEKLPLTGGELSGNLLIKNSESPQIVLNNTATKRLANVIADSEGGVTVSTRADDNNLTQLKVRSEKSEAYDLKKSLQLLRKVDGGVAQYYNIYGEHNKPTAADVSARPSTWMPNAADVGAVPTSRTVNGKALTANISLSASDVGARPNTWTPTISDISGMTDYVVAYGTSGVWTYWKFNSGLCVAMGNPTVTWSEQIKQIDGQYRSTTSLDLTGIFTAVMGGTCSNVHRYVNCFVIPSESTSAQLWATSAALASNTLYATQPAVVLFGRWK